MSDDSGDRASSAGHYGYHGHHHRGGAAHAGAHDVTDPVCGVRLDPHMTEHRVERPGQWHYFCSARCRSMFEANPERYAS